MENEILRNQLQSTRNILQTLAGNIDNTLLAFNQINRNNYRNRTSEARRNLSNLYQEIRNMYPTANTTNLNSTNLNSTNLNSANLNSNRYNLNNIPRNEINVNRTEAPNTTISNTLNNTLNSLINSRINNTTPQPDMIEVTLYNNGRTVTNMEDVPVYPSVRTLSRASEVFRYGNLDTEYESCTICRDRFDSNSIVRRLQCGHIFHISCIDTWFENNIRCPVCRSDLRDQQNDDDDDGDETETNLNQHLSGVESV